MQSEASSAGRSAGFAQGASYRKGSGTLARRRWGVPGSTSELAGEDDNTRLRGSAAGGGRRGDGGMEGPSKPSRRPQMWGHGADSTASLWA
ncbi:hypothetical protein SRHO_G00045140 [Serrasalmus rhombeus]